MGTIRRQSIQATLVMAVGVLLGFVLKLFVFTAYLTPEEIGLLTVLLDASNLFATFIPLGSQSIFVRYLPHFKEKERRSPRGLLFLGTALSLVGFFAFALIFLLFREIIAGFYAEQAPLFSKYMYLFLPLVLFRVIYLVGQAYARALKKNVFPLIIKEIIVRVLTGIIVIAFAAHWFDLDGLVLLFVGIYFLSGSVMSYYIFHKGFLNLMPSKEKLQMGKGREIFYFGLFAVMTSAGGVVIRNIDSLMLMSLEGLVATGVYGIAFFIGQIIEMPRRAISQITAPFVAEAAAKDDKKMISTLYHKSSINQFLVGVILLILVWSNIDNLFEIIPNGDLYRQGKYVVLFIGLGKLFDMSMGINSNIIQNSDHYRFNFYTMNLLGALGIVSNLLLIPLLGIEGAAIASLISISLVNIIKAIYIRINFGLQPFRRNSAIAMGVAIIVYAVSELLPALPHPLWDIGYRVLISGAVFLALVLRLKISTDINDFNRQLWKRINKHF